MRKMNYPFAAISRGLMGAAVTLCSALAHAAEVDLRVLVVAVGDRTEDEGRAAIEQLLVSLAIPHDILDASREELDPARLVSGARGRYNGIVLTNGETYLATGGNGFDASEFALLHDYERAFGVREAVLSGFPVTDAALGLDYGMGSVSSGDALAGRWQGRSLGTELFEYINTDNLLPTEGFAFTGRPRAGGPRVEPLLVVDGDPEQALISIVTYPDGREVLLSSLTQATFFLHTSLLAYEFLNFATSGLFIGARHVYLSVHNDDLFLADEIWNPETNSNFPEDQASYRLAAGEFAVVANAQRRFRQAHPLAPDLTIEFAFNGAGADLDGDPLTAAVMAYAEEFGFINHTYEALQMDWLCPDADEAGTCARTDYVTAFGEMEQNAQVWRQLGLPGAEHSLTAVLTDSHSGLNDRMGTLDDSDDVPFPTGFNAALGSAAEDLGVRVLASDASAINQGIIQRVNGHELVLLPRYPTAMFYNTTTPAELVSEYNYIFHYRHQEQGVEPCAVPNAICEPRTYAEILGAEAQTTLRHLLAFQPLPHYFHQSNLRVYDSQGNILQFDWLSSVLGAYEQLLDLPIESPRFHELADLAWRKVLAAEAVPEGWLDTATGAVTLAARAAARIEVTGISGGTLRAGQRVIEVEVSPTPQVLLVDSALNE